MILNQMAVLSLFRNTKSEESNMGGTSKHVHYEMILEWALNPSRTVQRKVKHPTDSTRDYWVDCAVPLWESNVQYRFKPVPQIQYYHLVSTTDSFGKIIVLLQKSNEYNWLVDESKIISRSKSFKVEDGMFPDFLGNFLSEEQSSDNSI